jgi:hypothetical protein
LTGGSPLPEPARRFFAQRFGHEFRDVRIHSGKDAAASAEAVNAKAFAYGRNIVFGEGHYDPHSRGGMRLLAHELTHVVQQTGWQPMVMRNGNESESGTGITMTVSMDGLTFDFQQLTYRAGATRGQLMALMLRRLLGTQYRTGLEDQVITRWEAGVRVLGSTVVDDLLVTSTARNGQLIGRKFVLGRGALVLLELLETEFGMQVALTETHRELLRLGLAATTAWQEVRAAFPYWYTENMFRREMAQHAALLREWRDVNPANRAAAGQVSNRIEGALSPAIEALEAVREDFVLANQASDTTGDVLERRNKQDCAVGYMVLWQVRLTGTDRLTAEPQGPVHEGHALTFLGFLRTQPALASEAIDPARHDTRRTLVARFARFLLRVAGGTTGDERLLNQPARANAPAWHATMTSLPELQPPLYDAALETDHAFTMSLEYGHWTDAFAMYAYRWEFIRIPESTLTDAPDLAMAAGERPSYETVRETRLARARRYNAADFERVRQRLGGMPFGQSAEDLVQINNALRMAGTVIRSFLDRATEPRYVTRIVFPSAGMYVVRCRAMPVLEGNEEVVRMPSVALLPAVARNPDEMAVTRVREQTRNEFQMRLRIAEIQSLLSGPFVPESAESLRAEMAELRAMLAGPGEQLSQRLGLIEQQISVLNRRLELRRQIAAIEAQPAGQQDHARLAALQRDLSAAGGDAGNAWDETRRVRALERQRDTVRNMLSNRTARIARETGTRFVPHATFVSDLGHSISLSLEMYDRGELDGAYQLFISDLTTPDSGQALGSAPMTASNPRREAILNGLRTLLETSSDYGRGRVAISIEGEISTVRIEAGTGRMLSEALESGAMVLSLAAIAAAPFTEGASLMILLPVGAVGAIPSAYRLYQRYDESRLRFDLAAVMDVVNIVGGVIGLAQVATPLRMVRLGRALMIMGVGVDGAGVLLMGAGVVAQLAELQSLPEHERAARMIEILGNAMLQIGIQAGGMIAHSRYQGRRTPGRPEETPGMRQQTDPPGFHPPREGTPAPGDRSMAGAGSGRPPAPRPAATPAAPAGGRSAPPAPRTSPEHLFDLLARGVDRSLPPPRPAGQVPHPPAPGDFRTGLMTADAAYRAYNEALAVSAGREVAIYHNPATGEYRVRIGSETGVSSPSGIGWNALLHYHPNEGNVLTFRLPAPQDFRGLLFRLMGEGTLVREFIEFDIPGVGRGRTEYGIDPGNREPFYVTINRPDGTSQTLRFAHDGAYRAYWGDRTVYVEPGSPTYDAMIRDIQSYIRSLGHDEGSFGPPGRTGAGSPAPPAGYGPAGRTATGAGSAASPRDLQTGTGTLTAAGVGFIRGRFARARDGSGRQVALSTLSDQAIMDMFPNQPAWLEALVVAQARADWLGRATRTDFVMANPNQTFHQVAARLLRAVSEGNTGHSLHDAILNWSVWDFVREMLAQNDPTLTPAYNALETHADPGIRQRWREFKLAARDGNMAGFFLGTVGSKRPDIVEVNLSGNAIHVVDASFAYNDPIHNFKSAFYRTVIERLINVGTVTATDYRAPLRQTPVGP